MRALAALLFGFATHVFAQSPPPPSTPSEPHEKLAFFEGEWTVAGMEAQKFRETCRWMPHGRRHMVCRSSWETPVGPREGMSIFSYDAAQAAYTYTGFRAGGARVLQAGAPTADGWAFAGDSGAGETRRRTRVTITATAEGMRFVEESATGDGPWKAGPEIRYLRTAR